MDFFVPLYLPIVHSFAKIDLQQSTIHKTKEFGCENSLIVAKDLNCLLPVIQLLIQNLKEKKRFVIQA